MSELHARLGPSNHRWPLCPGSIREESVYPDIPGKAAIDGTGSHELLELCIKHEVPAQAYVGRILGTGHVDNPNGWLIQDDRAERVQQCLNYIDRRVNELKEQGYSNVQVFSEEKANPGGLCGRDDWWGTVDITIKAFDETGVCRFVEICDYKDGQGWVSVKSKETGLHNTQLVSYAIGQVRKEIGSGPDKVNPLRTELLTGGVRISIVQPKTNPVVRYEDMTIDVLVSEYETLKWAAIATDDPNAPLKAGSHCKWCKHKSNCTQKSQESLEVVNTMTTENNPLIEMIGNTAVIDFKVMDNEKLSDLADSEAGIMAIFDNVKKEIESRIDAGQKVPGYAKKPGNSSRVWSLSEDEIVKKLKSLRMKKDDMYPPKLITPAQAMKLSSLSDKQKKKIESELISTVAGKLRLKKVSRTEQIDKVDFFSEVPDKTTNQNKPMIDFS